MRRESREDFQIQKVQYSTVQYSGETKSLVISQQLAAAGEASHCAPHSHSQRQAALSDPTTPSQTTSRDQVFPPTHTITILTSPSIQYLSPRSFDGCMYVTVHYHVTCLRSRSTRYGPTDLRAAHGDNINTFLFMPNPT